MTFSFRQVWSEGRGGTLDNVSMVLKHVHSRQTFKPCKNKQFLLFHTWTLVRHNIK